MHNRQLQREQDSKAERMRLLLPYKLHTMLWAWLFTSQQRSECRTCHVSRDRILRLALSDSNKILLAFERLARSGLCKTLGTDGSRFGTTLLCGVLLVYAEFMSWLRKLLTEA